MEICYVFSMTPTETLHKGLTIELHHTHAKIHLKEEEKKTSEQSNNQNEQ